MSKREHTAWAITFGLIFIVCAAHGFAFMYMALIGTWTWAFTSILYYCFSVVFYAMTKDQWRRRNGS